MIWMTSKVTPYDSMAISDFKWSHHPITLPSSHCDPAAKVGSWNLAKLMSWAKLGQVDAVWLGILGSWDVMRHGFMGSLWFIQGQLWSSVWRSVEGFLIRDCCSLLASWWIYTYIHIYISLIVIIAVDEMIGSIGIYCYKLYVLLVSTNRYNINIILKYPYKFVEAFVGSIHVSVKRKYEKMTHISICAGHVSWAPPSILQSTSPKVWISCLRLKETTISYG